MVIKIGFQIILIHINKVLPYGIKDGVSDHIEYGAKDWVSDHINTY